MRRIGGWFYSNNLESKNRNKISLIVISHYMKKAFTFSVAISVVILSLLSLARAWADSAPGSEGSRAPAWKLQATDKIEAEIKPLLK
jgi:hypothetical protein